MPPDDVGFAPALDAFGATVPDRHPTFGVEHVDRIIRRAVDEQPELVGARRPGAISGGARNARSSAHGSTELSGGGHGVRVPFMAPAVSPAAAVADPQRNDERNPRRPDDRRLRTVCGRKTATHARSDTWKPRS